MTNEEHIEDLHTQMAQLQQEQNDAWQHVDHLNKHVEKLNDRYRKLTSHDYSVMLARAWYNYKHNKSSIKADVIVHIDDKMPAI